MFNLENSAALHNYIWKYIYSYNKLYTSLNKNTTIIKMENSKLHMLFKEITKGLGTVMGWQYLI